jgi:hypothetical protein
MRCITPIGNTIWDERRAGGISRTVALRAMETRVGTFIVVMGDRAAMATLRTCNSTRPVLKTAIALQVRNAMEG